MLRDVAQYSHVQRQTWSIPSGAQILLKGLGFFTETYIHVHFAELLDVRLVYVWCVGVMIACARSGGQPP